jgi:hypothetical protein
MMVAVLLAEDPFVDHLQGACHGHGACLKRPSERRAAS